jgi:hypothetical protein
MNSKLCRDNLKYLLMNIIQKPSISDQAMFVTRRLLVYQNIYTIYRENRESDVKADNLYTLLYSKYFTQRYIARTLYNEDCRENDEDIKQNFRKILSDQIASSADLNNRYLKYIETIKPATDYKKYVEINECMDSLSKFKNKGEEFSSVFLVGTSETDIFLEKKISKDIAKLVSKHEKDMKILNDYKFFLYGWITAGGIAIMSTVTPLIKYAFG